MSSRPPTRALNLRAPVTIHERLQALAARVPAVSAHRLAVVALELGLELVERDPGAALVRPAGGPGFLPSADGSQTSAPTRQGGPASPRRGRVNPPGPQAPGDALRGRYATAVEGGATHVDLARDAGVSDRTLRAWSKGERGLSEDTARKVSEMLARRGL